MSLELFQKGLVFGSVPTPFLLALHPWIHVTATVSIICKTVRRMSGGLQDAKIL